MADREQLPLFEPSAIDPEREPDDRHEWESIPGTVGVRASETTHTRWRCNTCGELATVSAFTGKWLFLRPQLAKAPRGPWHYGNESHVCELRAWA